MFKQFNLIFQQFSDLTKFCIIFLVFPQPFSFSSYINIIFFSLKLLFEQSFKLFYSFYHELTVDVRNEIKKVYICISYKPIYFLVLYEKNADEFPSSYMLMINNETSDA